MPQQRIRGLLATRASAAKIGDVETLNASDAELDAVAESLDWDEESIAFCREFGEIHIDSPEIVPPEWSAFSELAAWMNNEGRHEIYSAIDAVPSDGGAPNGPLDLVSIANSLAENDQARVLAWCALLSELQRGLVDSALEANWHIIESFD